MAAVDELYEKFLNESKAKFASISESENRNSKKLLALFLHCGVVAYGLEPKRYKASCDVSGELEGLNVPFDSHEVIHLKYEGSRLITLCFNMTQPNVLGCEIRRNLVVHPFNLNLGTYTTIQEDGTYEITDQEGLLKLLYDVIN